MSRGIVSHFFQSAMQDRSGAFLFPVAVLCGHPAQASGTGLQAFLACGAIKAIGELFAILKPPFRLSFSLAKLGISRPLFIAASFPEGKAR
jgi:hypothetical protein